MANEKTGAWKRLPVPPSLVGETKKEIMEWARGKLNGQEPDLSGDDIKAIRLGTKKDVLLKPKKPGFYLPTGEFVEALGSISFSEDLDEADQHIEMRERDNAWADEENERFKQPAGTNVRAIWEHGKRIAAYVAEFNRPPYTIHSLLGARGGKAGYSKHAHQTASKLYEWKPNAGDNDPVFGWTWELADAVVKFAKQNTTRDLLLDLVETNLKPNKVPPGVIAVFLRGPEGKRGDLWQRSDPVRLGAYREKLKRGDELSEAEARELTSLLIGGSG